VIRKNLTSPQYVDGVIYANAKVEIKAAETKTESLLANPLNSRAIFPFLRSVQRQPNLLSEERLDPTHEHGFY
jgi:hypothetical protein